MHVTIIHAQTMYFVLQIRPLAHSQYASFCPDFLTEVYLSLCLHFSTCKLGPRVLVPVHTSLSTHLPPANWKDQAI